MEITSITVLKLNSGNLVLKINNSFHDVHVFNIELNRELRQLLAMDVHKYIVVNNEVKMTVDFDKLGSQKERAKELLQFVQTVNKGTHLINRENIILASQLYEII